MKILKSDLQNAATKEIITSDQADKLWNYFDGLRSDQGKFTPLHVIYYFGGILILASMSWFLTEAWSNGVALMMISLLFGVLYLLVGNNLWTKQNLKIPGGLLITAAIGLVPVFIYAFQNASGLWLQSPMESSYKSYHFLVKSNWLVMELGTIVAALVALRFYKFPFITFPLALSLWYMSMDLTPLLFGRDDFNFDERKIVSMIFGLFVLAAAYFVDKKYKTIDFAFWIYLYGMLAFWCGLSMMNSDDELGKFIYFLLNIGFIVLAVYLHRKLFMVFGVIGVFLYTGHLAWVVFKASPVFPIVLTFLGVLIIILGVKYQKNKDKFEAKIESWFPTFLNKYRPEERA